MQVSVVTFEHESLLIFESGASPVAPPGASVAAISVEQLAGVFAGPREAIEVDASESGVGRNGDC